VALHVGSREPPARDSNPDSIGFPCGSCSLWLCVTPPPCSPAHPDNTRRRIPPSVRNTALCWFICTAVHPDVSRVRVGSVCSVLVDVINASVVNQALAKRILPPNPTRLQWFLLTLATEASFFITANVTPALSDLLSVAGATCGMMLMMGWGSLLTRFPSPPDCACETCPIFLLQRAAAVLTVEALAFTCDF
jgi:hypothetical protein